MELWRVFTGHIKAATVFLNAYLRSYTHTQRLQMNQRRCFSNAVAACHGNAEDVSVMNARVVLLLAVFRHHTNQTTVPVHIELFFFRKAAMGGDFSV